MTWAEELSYEAETVDLFTGLADNKTSFFTMGGKCYIQDGAGLYVYDGTTVSNVTDNPYVPQVTISRPPAGGGSPDQDFNLLGRGFKDSFSADGTAKVYQLSLKELDSDTVTAEVNGSTMTEGSGFTVDRTAGKVTFDTAPSKGTNNVKITAYKTFEDFPDRIHKCRFNIIFGGANDTRVFVSGNPDYPNQIWQSGLYDPSYWPENGFYNAGSDDDEIQGFSQQYDYLVIEKKYSKWNMGFQLTETGVLFPIRPVNDQAGTLAENSIAIVENNPVSLTTKGVYRLKASNIRDERNVEHISQNVDSRLLREPNLENAVAVVFDKKYWLAVNGNVYLYDYIAEEWLLYDNINASCFMVLGDDLYFGGEGMIFRFKKSDDRLPYNDDEVHPINAYWYSKLMDFERPERRKTVKKIFHTLKPAGRSSSSLSIRTDKKGEELVSVSKVNMFNLTTMDLNNFSLIMSDVPQEIADKVKKKKITHFQVKIENKEMNESLGIIEVGLDYRLGNEVR